MTHSTKRSTKILSRGIDPIVVKLRTEQVRQELSDYALSALISKSSDSTVTASTLGKIWKGKASPGLVRIRSILAALRRPKEQGGNPGFVLTDP
jgi:hypothetical protein